MMILKVKRLLVWGISVVMTFVILIKLKKYYMRTGLVPTSLVVTQCWSKSFNQSKAASQHYFHHPSSALKKPRKRAPQVLQVFNSRPSITQINCTALLTGEEAEQDKAFHVMDKVPQVTLSGNDYIRLTRDCDKFKSSRGYITVPLSKEEKNFPIAFSIMMYRDIEQSEHLLRAIYHPQNFYCVHVDKKSTTPIRQGMEAIAKCLDNVFVVAHPVDIEWGTFSVLESELLCMRELWAYKKWKYLINLTGQEFPLKTNRELVTILQDYKGANNIQMLDSHSENFFNRWEYAGQPPHGITPVYGSLKITVSRGFVDYVLHNQKAKDFLQWVKTTKLPDEVYFQSLNGNQHLGVPGSFRGKALSDEDRNPFLGRFVVWFYSTIMYPCHGKFVREVCVFGVKDLPLLIPQPHLFVNKFHWDYQHLARDCMEEWHFNKTRDEFLYDLQFNDTCYRDLEFVKYQYPQEHRLASWRGFEHSNLRTIPLVGVWVATTRANIKRTAKS